MEGTMDTFTAYLIYSDLGRYGVSLVRPGSDVIFDELTLELPAGWSIDVNTDGSPMLFEPNGMGADLFATEHKTIGAVASLSFRYFRRLPATESQPKTLRDFRVSAGMTQQQLSDASGVNIRQIQRVEGGESSIDNVSAKNLLALSDALGVEPRQLLNR